MLLKKGKKATGDKEGGAGSRKSGCQSRCH